MINASDAPGLLGFGYDSRSKAVFAMRMKLEGKTAEKTAPEFQQRCMETGIRCEPLIRDAFLRDHPQVGHWYSVGSFEMESGIDDFRFRASPDGMLHCPAGTLASPMYGETAVVEIKTNLSVGNTVAKHSGLSPMYIIQTYMQMRTTGCKYGVVIQGQEMGPEYPRPIEYLTFLVLWQDDVWHEIEKRLRQAVRWAKASDFLLKIPDFSQEERLQLTARLQGCSLLLKRNPVFAASCNFLSQDDVDDFFEPFTKRRRIKT
jgi:hypothetical protein